MKYGKKIGNGNPIHLFMLQFINYVNTIIKGGAYSIKLHEPGTIK